MRLSSEDRHCPSRCAPAWVNTETRLQDPFRVMDINELLTSRIETSEGFHSRQPTMIRVTFCAGRGYATFPGN